MLRDAGVMLAAGIGVPILAAISAQLGSRIGAPLVAGALALFVALVVAGIAATATGQLRPLTEVAARIADQPLWLLIGGVFMAFYLLSITWIAPRFGVGNAVFCVLLGQMIAASLIDHFGLFEAKVMAVSGLRLTGILTMAFGLFLIQRG